MKIAVDARYLAGAPSGIGRYSAGLLGELARIDRENSYVIFTHDSYAPPEVRPPNFRYIGLPHRPLSAATLLKMGGVIDRERCDFVHVHYPVVPLFMKTPLMITMHDWQPLTVPDFSGARPWPMPALYAAFYRWHYRLAVRRARRIVAVSEHTRNETIGFVASARQKVETIHSGIGHEYLQGADTREPGSRTLDLPSRYILYVGSTRPNKELSTLIGAYARLREQREDPREVKLVLQLVIDRFFEPCRARIRDLGLTEDVVIRDSIAERDLEELYRRAEVVSMATTDEGFGFPVLEAMAMGVPVVIASHGALPEIAGDAALAVPPKDAGALSEAFEKILTDEDVKSRLKRAGPRRAARFDWRRTAESMLQLYRSMA